MGYIVTDGKRYVKMLPNTRLTITDSIEEAFVFKSDVKCRNVIRKMFQKDFGWFPAHSETLKPIVKRMKFSDTQRKAVFGKTNGICSICGKKMDFDIFTVDHIIPIVKGGTNQFDNLQPAHKSCNNIKNDALPEELIDKVTDIFMYQNGKRMSKAKFFLLKRIIGWEPEST